MSGSVAAQLLPLVLTPLLTRMYVPTAFGLFGVFLALENMLTLVVAGRLDVALVLATGDEEATDLASAALSVSIVVSSVVAIVCASLAFGSLGRTSPTFLLLMPPMVLLAGFSQTMSFWSTRRGEFRRVALGQFIQMFGYTTGAAAIGALGWRSGEGMAAGYMVGQVAVASFFAVVNRGHAGRIVAGIASTRAVAAMCTHRRFPLVNGPHALVDGLRDSAVVSLIAGLFGAAANGAFTLAQRVLRAPTATLGQAVFQVLYQRSARAQARGELVGAPIRRALRWLVVATLPVFAVVVPCLPWLFGVVFGGEWRVAGVYAQILSPWIYVNFLASALSGLPLLKGRQLRALGIAVIDALLRCAAIGAGWLFHDVRVALALLSLSGVLVSCWLLAWFLRLVRDAAPPGPVMRERSDTARAQW